MAGFLRSIIPAGRDAAAGAVRTVRRANANMKNMNVVNMNMTTGRLFLRLTTETNMIIMDRDAVLHAGGLIYFIWSRSVCRST